MAKAKFKLALINPDKTEVYKVLGISEERSDEIVEMATESYQSKKYFSETLEELVSKMNHINEVVFATLMASRIHHKKDQLQLEEKIKSMEILVELLKFKQK